MIIHNNTAGTPAVALISLQVTVSSVYSRLLCVQQSPEGKPTALRQVPVIAQPVTVSATIYRSGQTTCPRGISTCYIRINLLNYNFSHIWMLIHSWEIVDFSKCYSSRSKRCFCWAPTYGTGYQAQTEMCEISVAVTWSFMNTLYFVMCIPPGTSPIFLLCLFLTVFLRI